MTCDLMVEVLKLLHLMSGLSDSTVDKSTLKTHFSFSKKKKNTELPVYYYYFFLSFSCFCHILDLIFTQAG